MSFVKKAADAVKKSSEGVGDKANPPKKLSKEKNEQSAKSDKKPKKGSKDPLTPPMSLITATPNRAAEIVMKRFAILTIGKGVNGLLKEYADLKAVCPPPTPEQRVSFDRSPDKNRYKKDIFCWEENRVVLTWPPDASGGDYIHANWIAGLPDVPRKIICTQAPMERTVADFWRMVWQEKCQSIMMLCSLTENGKKKCERYWPATEGTEMKHANLTIKNHNVVMQDDIQVTKLSVSGKHLDGRTGEHIVVHVHWTGWPDKSVPASSTGAIRAIVRTQNFSPLVVHCSAGVGRTGTIVVIEAALRMLLAGREVSIYNVVKEVRSQRYMACQTDLQYLYIHRAIIAYITSKNVMMAIQVSRFVEDYNALVDDRKQAKTVDQ
ncbi:protein-tyrosine phosphatase domain-containing protein [Ditylenchus destructor]|uniref:Protein-tyrosine phosphatase domain-containing protein n=1 Tax=Ditylenchus destructor TaxID=166010 RepID=A0AAD4QWK1_9BILA|nr:protein-tyrosine phosphatase domain-containing protein [Ditylenchus destructor]